MISIDVKSVPPIGCGDCRLRGRQYRLRPRTDGQMFSMGFIPDRDHVPALMPSLLKCGQLGSGLMGKTIADTKGELSQGFHEAT